MLLMRIMVFLFIWAIVNVVGADPGRQLQATCTETITSRCCGDNVCDGPETSDNCAADCTGNMGTGNTGPPSSPPASQANSECDTEPAEKPTEPTLCTSQNQGCCDCGRNDVHTYVFWPGDGSTQRCFHTYNIPSGAPSGGPLPVLLGMDGYAGGRAPGNNYGDRGTAAKYYGFAAFTIGNNLRDGNGGFGLEFGNNGIANDANPTPCASSDSREIVYLEAVFKFITDRPTLLDSDQVFTEGFSQNSMFAIYTAVCFAHMVRGTWQGGSGMAKTFHDPVPPGVQAQCTLSSALTHGVESCCANEFCTDCQYWPIYPKTCANRLTDCIAAYTDDNIACGSDWYMYEAMVTEGNDARLLSFPPITGGGGHQNPKNQYAWMAGCLGLAPACSSECETSFSSCVDSASDSTDHEKFQTCEGRIEAGELSGCTSGCAPTLEMLLKSEEAVVTLSQGNFGTQTGLTQASGSAPRPNCQNSFGKFSDRTGGRFQCEAPDSYVLPAESPRSCSESPTPSQSPSPSPTPSQAPTPSPTPSTSTSASPTRSPTPSPPPAPTGGVPPCSASQTNRCCGDNVCDGPENQENCATDCGNTAPSPVPMGSSPTPSPPPAPGGVPPCSESQTNQCCGDNVCDGPENRENCAADCANTSPSPVPTGNPGDKDNDGCQTEPAEKPTEPALCTSQNQGCCDCGMNDVQTYVFWPGDGSMQRCFHTYNVPSSPPSGGPLPVLLGMEGYGGGRAAGNNYGDRGTAAKYYGFAAFGLGNTLEDGAGGFGLVFGNNGIVNDSNPTPCSSSDSRDIVYLEAVFKFIADRPTLLDADQVFTEGFSQNSMFAIYTAVCFADKVTGTWQGGSGLAKTAHDPIVPGFQAQCSASSNSQHSDQCCKEDFCTECQYWPIYPRTCGNKIIDCIAAYTDDGIACGSDWYMYEAMVAEGNDARLLSFSPVDGGGGHQNPKNEYAWMAGCLGLAPSCSSECATAFSSCIDTATGDDNPAKFETCEDRIKAGEMSACTPGCAPTLEMLQKSEEAVVTLSDGNFGTETGLPKADGSAPRPNCRAPFGKWSDLRQTDSRPPRCEHPDSWTLPEENPRSCPSPSPSPSPQSETATPTPAPTPSQTPSPTLAPTPVPILSPTPVPTPVPTLSPTPVPTPVPTPGPTPAPTPAPPGVVVQTTSFSSSVVMSDVTQFDQAEYIKSVEEASSDQGEIDATVTSVDYQVQQTYQLGGAITITETQATAAMADLLNVPESAIEIRMITSRRLTTARVLQSASFEAIITASSSSAVAAIADRAVDLDAMADAVKSALGVNTDPAVTAIGTPTQMVKVMTEIVATGDTPLAAPNEALLSTRLTTNLGTTAQTTVGDVTQRSTGQTSAPTPAPTSAPIDAAPSITCSTSVVACMLMYIASALLPGRLEN